MPRNILKEPQAQRIITIGDDELDELFKDAVEVVCQYDRASPSLIQRRLSVGYARASRIIDQLQSAKVVGPADGSKPRDVLIKNSEEVLKQILETPREEEEVDIEVNTPKYKKPNLKIINKPKDNPWKYSLYDTLKDKSFKNSEGFPFPIGFTEDKKLVTADLDGVKHLIIGGYSLSQKEVMLDTILTSLLLKASPNDLKLILIDSVRYLNFYDNLPHLLTPVINETEKSISAFRWLMHEMDRRLKIFNEIGVRDLSGFNEKSDNLLPHILVMINQFEDCLFYSPVEVEDALTRILMLAPRCGVHVIFTANHLTKQFVPTGIQSEIPNRLLFRFTSYHDAGSGIVTEVEKLQPGEALYMSDNNPIKLDAIYTSEENIKKVVNEIIK